MVKKRGRGVLKKGSVYACFVRGVGEKRGGGQLTGNFSKGEAVGPTAHVA